MRKTCLLACLAMCISTLGCSEVLAYTDPPREDRSLPDLRSLPSSVRSLDYRVATLPRSGLDATNNSIHEVRQQSAAGGSKNRLPHHGVVTSTGGLHVKVCEREPNILGGKVADMVGRPHKWMVVEDDFGSTVHAPGLGNKRGVPGANGQSSPDCPLSRSYVRDHTDEIPRSCKPFPAVDPQCIVSKTPYNNYERRWMPFINDCNSFVDRTVDACRLPNLRTSVLINPRPANSPDGLTLVPELEPSPRYHLGVDLEVTKTLTPPHTRFTSQPSATASSRDHGISARRSESPRK